MSSYLSPFLAAQRTERRPRRLAPKDRKAKLETDLRFGISQISRPTGQVSVQMTPSLAWMPLRVHPGEERLVNQVELVGGFPEVVHLSDPHGRELSQTPRHHYSPDWDHHPGGQPSL